MRRAGRGSLRPVPADLFALTAVSATANYRHGRQADGQQAALYLGGMNIAVALVFALALRQIRHEDRRRAGTVTDRLPRFSLAPWAPVPAHGRWLSATGMPRREWRSMPPWAAVRCPAASLIGLL